VVSVIAVLHRVLLRHAPRHRVTSPLDLATSRIRVFANTVSNTIRRPDAIQYVTRIERP
jgi:hypothetical protein